MDLEQLIAEVYSSHQANLKAKKEARLLKEQEQIEFVVNSFRQKLDSVITPEMQACLGILVSGNTNQAIATFVYVNVCFTIFTSDGYWWMIETDRGDSFGQIASQLFNNLLIKMGEIRQNLETESVQSFSKETLQKLNLNYCEIKAMIEDPHWDKLVKKSELGVEMQSHVGDILHYLSELMDCIQEEIL